MEKISRRKFLTLVGAGSGAIAVGAALPATGLLNPTRGKDIVAIRAVGGLPSGGPVPAYASFLLEGHVDVAARSGVITRTVFAGPPERMSSIALPSLSRVYRIKGVRDLGDHIDVAAEVEDRAQLRAGEASRVEFRVDRVSGAARAPFFASAVRLQATS